MRVVDQAKNPVALIEDRTHEQPLDQLLWMMRTRPIDGYPEGRDPGSFVAEGASAAQHAIPNRHSMGCIENSWFLGVSIFPTCCPHY